jgi:hypothetical protein
MQPQAPSRDFRSSIGQLLVKIRNFGLCGFVAFPAYSALAQYTANRFPKYGELVEAAAIPVAIAGTMALLLWGAKLLFPVKVFPTAIRCYDTAGLYQTVQWSEITRAAQFSTYGLTYIEVYAAHINRPLTIPLWLEDLSGFIAAIENYAGENHRLTLALKGVA